MSGGQYAVLLGVWFLAVVVPGQDLAVVLGGTATGGRRAGIMIAAGIASGVAVWTIAALVGLGIALNSSPMTLATLEILSGAALLALSVQGLRGPARGRTERQPADGDSRPAAPFVIGLLTNLANPKALAFFGSLFTTVVPATAGTIDHVAVLAIIVGGEFAWFGLISVSASSGAPGRWLARHERAIAVTASFVLAVIGIAAVATGLARLT